MKRIIILLLILTFAVGAVGAQDVETTPSPGGITILDTNTGAPVAGSADTPVLIIRDENPVLLIALAIAAVVIAVLGGFVVVLARKGFDSLPEWARDLVLYNGPQVEARIDEGFDTLDRMTALTPNTLDDLLVKYGRTWVETRIKAFFDEAQQDAAAPPITPQG